MRLLLLMLGICIGIVVIIEKPAEAQSYPWCAQYSGDGGMNCGFTTFQQCLADVSGIGGFCGKVSERAGLLSCRVGKLLCATGLSSDIIKRCQ
jgi:hypothetical protein